MDRHTHFRTIRTCTVFVIIMGVRHSTNKGVNLKSTYVDQCLLTNNEIKIWQRSIFVIWFWLGYQNEEVVVVVHTFCVAARLIFDQENNHRFVSVLHFWLCVVRCRAFRRHSQWNIEKRNGLSTIYLFKIHKCIRSRRGNQSINGLVNKHRLILVSHSHTTVAFLSHSLVLGLFCLVSTITARRF